ncbi:hypothetical protein MIR68_011149 [Amoeboaphelidium protococcarum]|nr:hypothetical protein MIR68_011149 [Amoeboaphelidium protococcarum]
MVYEIKLQILRIFCVSAWCSAHRLNLLAVSIIRSIKYCLELLASQKLVQIISQQDNVAIAPYPVFVKKGTVTFEVATYTKNVLLTGKIARMVEYELVLGQPKPLDIAILWPLNEFDAVAWDINPICLQSVIILMFGLWNYKLCCLRR